MSAETVSPGPLRLDAKSRHVLRYATGATLGMGLAMAVNWPAAYLVPVLCLTFLAKPVPPPTLRAGLMFLAALVVAITVGLWAIKYLLGSGVLFFTGLGLLLLHVFYAQCSGASPILILWLLIALLALPMVAVQSPDMALVVSSSLVFGAAASLMVAWIAHALFPETRSGPSASAPAPTTQAPAHERFVAALERMAVVFPLFVLFHLFEWTGSLVILIFVGLLSIQPGFASGFKAGAAMILGNAMGGMAAIAAFELLTVVPEFLFLILLCLLAGLFLGNRLLGGGKAAPLYGMAFSTMLLVLGSSTSSEGDARAAAYSRILQIMIAVLYVVFSFGLIERLRGRGRK